MSNVRLDIGGRPYDVTVRDGQEGRFHTLADLVDARCRDAARSAGGLTEVRQLLFAALMLADDVREGQDAVAAANATRFERDTLRDENATLKAELEASRAGADAIETQAEAILAQHEILTAENDALAAEVAELRAAAVAATDRPADPEAAQAIERLAERAESFADGLEKARATP